MTDSWLIADIRLNPEMEINCKDDVVKFCKKEFEHIEKGKLNEGKIIACLKKHKEVFNTLSIPNHDPSFGLGQ